MFPFIATISQAAGIIVDKIILTRRRVELHVYIPVLFLFLMLVTSLLVPFLGWVDLKIFQPYYLLVFVGMIISALVWNVFYYKGAQEEKVQEFELIIMFQPLFTILLAAVFIERSVNVHILIASIIASVTLIVAHLKKMHFEMDRTSYGLILAVLLMSIEILFQKILLEVMSPAVLYFARTLILFAFFQIYYHPKWKVISNITTAWILLTASMGVLQMVTKFYGFNQFGVIYTSLILTLSPVMVYILSNVILHEKLKARTIISVVVILASIIYATIFEKL